jgi:hypothetical protein
MATSDIVMTGAVVYHAPTGTTLPLNTLAAGAAWLTPWVNAGLTLDPVVLNYSFDVVEVIVQQAMAPVRRRRKAESCQISTTLAEHTALNMEVAFAGASAVTPAASAIPGYEVFTVGGDPALPENLWGIEGTYEDSTNATFPIRIYCWRGTSSDGGETTYDKENPSGIKLTIKGLADTTKPIKQQLLKMVRVTAAALP